MLASLMALPSCSSDEPALLMEEPQPTQQATTQLTQSQAQDVAALFATDRYGVAPVKSRSSQAVETVYNISGDPVAYVVNNEGGGWVIVSATKCYHPILAYSDKADASFHLANSNPGIDMWLDDVRQAVTDSEQLPDSTARQIAMEWLQYETLSGPTIGGGLPGGNSPEAVACRNRLKVLNETYYKQGWKFMTLSSAKGVGLPSGIYQSAQSYGSPEEYTIVGYRIVTTKNQAGPLISTEWHQGKPFSTTDYNALCPNQYYVGCVPVAIGQIMKFHRFPSSFDWNDMSDTTPTYATQYLLADIGKKAGAVYTIDGTNANITGASAALVTYGYKTSIKAHNDSEEINYLINNKRPIYMRGDNGTGAVGHAWVCDGVISEYGHYEDYVEYLTSSGEYSTYGETSFDNPGAFGNFNNLRYHFNWGWEEVKPGWFMSAVPTSNITLTKNRKNIYISK